MNLLGLWVKMFTLALVIFAGMEVIYWLSVGLDAMEKVDKEEVAMRPSKSSRSADPDSIELKDYSAWLSSGSAMQPNHLVRNLPYPSLRTKSEELREEYNRRHRIIQVVDERKEKFLKQGSISKSLAAGINRNLDILRRQNNQVKVHYTNIIRFAEKKHLESQMEESARLDARAEELLRENVALLQTLETPLIFR